MTRPLNLDRHPFPVRNINGLDIAVIRRKQAVEYLLDCLNERRPIQVAFANTHFVNSAMRYGLIAGLSRHFFILNDGIGLDIISLILHGERFTENLNGTDFTDDLLSKVAAGTRIFLFGTRSATLTRAAVALESRFGIRICGAEHGFVGVDRWPAVADRIRQLAPDIVLVGLGSPVQEQWILAHGDELKVPIVAAVGAFLEFSAGTVRRAPDWVQRLRLEWLFRLMQEPRRLWRRYTVDIGMLLIETIKWKLRMHAR